MKLCWKLLLVVMGGVTVFSAQSAHVAGELLAPPLNLDACLLDAAQKNDLEGVIYYLYWGANINVHDSMVLRWAVCRGNEAMVKELLERNINLFNRDNNGNYPEFYATNPRIKNLIIAVLNETFVSGPSNGLSLADLKKLLDRGIDINFRDNEKNTVLMNVLESESVEIEALVNLFLEKGVEINAQNDEGQTALMIAAQRSPHTPADNETTKRIIEMLWRKGADVTAVDSEGKTVAQYAGENSEISNLISELLEEDTYVKKQGAQLVEEQLGGSGLRGLTEIVKGYLFNPRLPENNLVVSDKDGKIKREREREQDE